MNRKETAAIMDRLSRLYMIQMKKLSREEKASMLETWAEQFKDDPYQTVLDAVNIYANKGKAFLPGPPDIVAEILRLEERKDYKLFDQLESAAKAATSGEPRIVVVDPGGCRWSEEHQRMVYFHPECRYTTSYTVANFATLPLIIQAYAEDIEGLKAIKKEIDSNRSYARKRFIDALPYLRKNLEAMN